VNESDKENFINMVTATLELYGRRYTMPETYQLWFEALKPFDRRAVFEAMQTWTLGGKSSAPVPADIIKILQAKDGWLEPEEAWAIVRPTLISEGETVFWTPPMQVAFGAALNLADDLVAARMTFKEVYARELAAARERGEKPTWQASPGTNPGMRQAATEEALRLGRITPEYAQKLLPPPDDDNDRLPPPDLQIKRIEAAE
jgi:hypothetical protein